MTATPSDPGPFWASLLILLAAAIAVLAPIGSNLL